MLPPAWAAPDTCLSAKQIQQALGTKPLLSDASQTPDSTCAYLHSPASYGYGITPDDTLTDPSSRSSKATYTPAPELGTDAMKVTMKVPFGSKDQGVCRYHVRLDQDHGAWKTSGDRLTTLMVAAGQEGVDPESMCPAALTLLKTVSHRIAFAPGFTPLPRYVVTCDISADAQAAKLTEFFRNTFTTTDSWADDPDFEAVAHPVVYRLVERCGGEYAQDTINSIDAVGGAYDALSTWLTDV